MRKTFVKIFAGALALLAMSSCGKIWDEFDAVHGELDDLTTRVAELEKKLNSEVATLSAAITTLEGNVNTGDEALDAALAALATELKAKDTELAGLISDAVSGAEGALEALAAELAKLAEKHGTDVAGLEEALKNLSDEMKAQLEAAVKAVAVQKVEKKDGVVVLTLADGSTVTVADAGANQIVTVKDGEWAVVKADGTVESLGIPVGTVVEFKVGDDNQLVCIVNGEEIPTGAYVAAEDYYLVTDFVDGENYVTITIGGVEYTLPKANASAVFEILSGIAYFESMEMRSIPLNVEGVVSTFVANCPLGWDVKINGNALTVVAPNEEDTYSSMDYETWEEIPATAAGQGTIEIWVVLNDGRTVVGKVAVALDTPGVEFTVAKDTLYASFSEYIFYNIVEESEFDPAAIYEAIYDYTGSEDMYEGVAPEGFYVNLKSEGYGYNPSAKHALADMLGAAPEVGKTYVIWAYKNNNVGMPDGNTLFYKQFYQPVSVKGTAVASWDNADLKVEVVGADQYLAIQMYKDQYEYYKADYWQGEMYEYFLSMGMCFFDILTGDMADVVYYKENYDGKMSLYGVSDPAYAWSYLPGNEVVVLALPMVGYKTRQDYTPEDLVVVAEVTMSELLGGGSATVAFGDYTAEYESVSLPIEATGKVFYKYWKTSVFEEIEDVETEMLEDLESCYVVENASEPLELRGLSVGTSYTVAAFAVDASGKYCDVVTKEVTTKAYPIDDTNLSVAITNVVLDATAKTATVTYSVKGAAKLATYGNASGARCQGSSNTNTFTKYLATQPEHYTIQYHDVVDGTVTVIYANYTANYYKWVWASACVKDGATNTSYSTPYTYNVTTFVPAE